MSQDTAPDPQAQAAEHFGSSPKKPGRGMAQRSIDLIAAMYEIAEAAQPITGRGVGYQLFVRQLISSMEEMKGTVYRLLLQARERGTIPWNWIVDETRSLERVSTWEDPEAYAQCVARSYRRAFWNQQPARVEVWSEKGTIRGVLQPVLDAYAVGFRVLHGFSSATTLNEVAEDYDGRDLIVLYVGDYDPSGLYMSERDLPERLARYGGHHVDLRRIALTRAQVTDLPPFPAADKGRDTRYRWFVEKYGHRCWELDAMDPRVLRDCVEQSIIDFIDPEPWERCERVNEAEQESLRDILNQWPARKGGE
jgi:hypothetical protein